MLWMHFHSMEYTLPLTGDGLRSGTSVRAQHELNEVEVGTVK